ncbi:hypothetical protein CVS40_8391 [Lucilia cuprina]|nr:hypothetical protein CVS40_8391 [Lucilia cuprina]
MLTVSHEIYASCRSEYEGECLILTSFLLGGFAVMPLHFAFVVVVLPLFSSMSCACCSQRQGFKDGDMVPFRYGANYCGYAADIHLQFSRQMAIQ